MEIFILGLGSLFLAYSYSWSRTFQKLENQKSYLKNKIFNMDTMSFNREMEWFDFATKLNNNNLKEILEAKTKISELSLELSKSNSEDNKPFEPKDFGFVQFDHSSFVLKVDSFITVVLKSGEIKDSWKVEYWRTIADMSVVGTIFSFILIPDYRAGKNVIDSIECIFNKE